jgi:hypothetical protein
MLEYKILSISRNGENVLYFNRILLKIDNMLMSNNFYVSLKTLRFFRIKKKKILTLFYYFKEYQK